MRVAVRAARGKLHEREHAYEHCACKDTAHEALGSREERERHEHAHVTRADKFACATMHAKVVEQQHDRGNRSRGQHDCNCLRNAALHHAKDKSACEHHSDKLGWQDVLTQIADEQCSHARACKREAQTADDVVEQEPGTECAAYAHDRDEHAKSTSERSIESTCAQGSLGDARHARPSQDAARACVEHHERPRLLARPQGVGS